MRGLQHGTVELRSDHKGWAKFYDKEEIKISDALKGRFIRVEHIGSTSIPRLPAKPIVDVVVVVSKSDINTDTDSLTDVGYEYRGDKGNAGGHLFIWVLNNIVNSHIHMVNEADRQWRDYLLFRDFLRDNSAVRMEYADVKRELARRFSKDRKLYTEGKAEIYTNIIERARVNMSLT